MKTYYIHPVEPGKPGRPIHKVTTRRVYKRYGREITEDVHAAWFDPPGTYWDDEWNLHYDGCDYHCKDIEECKKKLSELDGFEFDINAKNHYRRVETKFVIL